MEDNYNDPFDKNTSKYYVSQEDRDMVRRRMKETPNLPIFIIGYGANVFTKQHWYDKIWEVDTIGFRDGLSFSFDKKRIYHFHRDYPHHLTPKQIKIFNKQFPYWYHWYNGQ